MGAASPGEAATAAKAVGFPVAMKINSPDITCKTAVGGVQFNLHNQTEVVSTYENIVQAVRTCCPEASILGVTVQTMEKRPDCELFIGSKRDPDFGPLLLFGVGGICAEILEDNTLGLPPMNLSLAHREIERTRIYRVLERYQHILPGSLDQLAEILVRISQLVTDFPEIVKLDIDPLFLTNGRFVAVDARLAVEPATVPAPRHLIITPFTLTKAGEGQTFRAEMVF